MFIGLGIPRGEVDGSASPSVVRDGSSHQTGAGPATGGVLFEKLRRYGLAHALDERGVPVFHCMACHAQER
jgi:hypothetical protein